MLDCTPIQHEKIYVFIFSTEKSRISVFSVDNFFSNIVPDALFDDEYRHYRWLSASQHKYDVRMRS